MQTPDEQLRERIPRAAPTPASSEDLFDRLSDRRSGAAARRPLAVIALAACVVLGTLAGYTLLSRAFAGEDEEPAQVVSTGVNGPVVTLREQSPTSSFLVTRPTIGAPAHDLTQRGDVLIMDPAASRDGRYLAFVLADQDDVSNDTRRLVVFDVASGTSRTIATGIFFEPSWSPEGDSVVVESMESDWAGLVVIDVQTGDRRRLVPGADPAWSPDGAQIAFELPSDRPPNRLKPQGIFVVPASGGDPVLVGPEGYSPAWSPDGAKIAYTDADGIRTVPAPGGATTLVASVGRADAILLADPGWSPDGTYLTYRAVSDSLSVLMADPLDGSAPIEVDRTIDYVWLPQADPPIDVGEPQPSEDEVCTTHEVTGHFFGEDGGLDTARLTCDQGRWELAFEWASGASGVSGTACTYDCRFWAVSDLDGDDTDELIMWSSWKDAASGAEWYPLEYLFILVRTPPSRHGSRSASRTVSRGGSHRSAASRCSRSAVKRNGSQP